MESGHIKINDIDLPVKEYNGQRVITLKDVDTVHQRPEGTARKRFNDNKKHFIEGVDFFVRNSDEAREEFGITAPNGLTLITESGYLMLVKSFTDDLAWIVQRQLVNTYFRATPQQRQEAAKQTLSDMEILARAVLISQKAIEKQKKVIEQQNAKIEADAAAVAFANDISLSKHGISIERYAKSLNDKYGIQIGRNRMFQFLRDEKILKSDNLPYQKYMEQDWFQVRAVTKNGDIFHQTLICGKGQQKVNELIKNKFLKTEP